MRDNLKNTQVIYLCKKIINSNPISYEQPIKLQINIHTTFGDMKFTGFGEEVYNMLQSTTSKYKDLFSENDRVYFNNLPPQIHDELVEKADLIVFKILKSKNSSIIIYKKLLG